MTITGLILNYRDAARTSRCIESLLADDVEPVWVWDNSADKGVSARQLAQRWHSDHRVVLQGSPINLGFAAGVNRGLDRIRPEFPTARVLLINNDAELLPNAVAALHQALDDSPEASLAYPAIEHGGRIIETAHYHRLLGLITARPLPGSFPYPSGCCLLIDLKRVPASLFDEDFFMYGEDIELGWRLGQKGMVHVPRTLVRHEGSASSGMGSPFYEARMVAAHWRLARKLARNPADRALLILSRFLTLSARALVRTLRNRSMTPVKALKKGWCIAHGKDPLHRQAQREISKPAS